ncbi:MAG: hypothetical protein SRB1_01318 [Desulfobacteraceae bacterium Eth-SRB1]|nr:MAG: hypothetical protein SRB1_01318 [Desulfobacteraceae bacterium Eth-SRB1]
MLQQPHKYNPDDFPEFNLNQLERYAKRWAEKYSVIQIQKITLHSLDSEYRKVACSVFLGMSYYAICFGF